MYKADKCSGLIYILLDETFHIQYANMDKESAKKYIKKLGALNKLPNDSPCQYDMNGYSVTIDKISIAGNMYYVINAVPYHSKCEGCEKALIDSVTGLYNRNYWERFEEVATFHSKIPNFFLILIDIDNLKEINDNQGHIAGDKAIKIVGKAIKSAIRKGDLGIRYGGDEFLIIFFNQDIKYAEKIIERIRKKINQLASENNMKIEISTGTACYDSLGDIKKIINAADKGLYKEKREKKTKENYKNEEMKELLKEIERLRDELNKKVIEDDYGINSQEALNISNKLDKLITKYLRKEIH